MPSSRDPHNYPPSFYTLVQKFPNAPDAIEVTVPDRNKALAFRVQFYSFIRACETYAEKQRKAGQLDEYAEYQGYARLARTRQVEVYPSLASLSQEYCICFRSRDSAPVIKDIMAQIDAMHIQTAPPEITGIPAAEPQATATNPFAPETSDTFDKLYNADDTETP